MCLYLGVRIMLACLSLTAVYAKYYLSMRNGFIPMLAMLKAQNSLPGNAGPLRARYTMCGPVDNFLAACTLFFWPILNGNSGSLSMYGLAFAGAVVPAWIIIANQTRRSTNLRRSLAGDLISGLALQCIGPGVVVPALLAMKPLTMTEVRCRTPSHFIYLPMLLFYALPLFLASRVAPDIVSVPMRQQLIGLWQGWPVYVSVSLAVLQWPKLDTASCAATFHRRVHAYAFAFACSSAPHFTLLTRFGTASSGYNAKSLIMPRLFWGADQVASVEHGVLHFLQWDYTISVSALLIWCMALFYHHHHARTQGGTSAGSTRLVLWILVVGLVFGPCSAAIILYHQAEEFAWRNADEAD